MLRKSEGGKCHLHSDQVNHDSALDHPTDVDAYLKATIDPFYKSPISSLHYSPFMTGDKPNSNTRRVIIDLSWPYDSSVNDGVDKFSYLGTDF